jgi:Cysteine rich repeat
MAGDISKTENEMMKMTAKLAIASCLTLAAVGPPLAQQSGKGPGQGPVITQCRDDIAKFCASKSHDGEVRACLAAKKSEVTAACKTALDATGGGQGRKQ